MSVSYFKYPDRNGMRSVTGESFFGTLEYRKDNSILLNVPYGTGFSCPPNAEDSSGTPTDIILMELSNGIQIILDYVCWVTQYTAGETYHISAFIRADDLDGNNVYPRTSIIGGATNKTITSLGTPYEDCYFVPGKVVYSANNPTIVGEEATQVSFGVIYVKNVNQLLPTDLFGEHTKYDITNTWSEQLWLPCDNDTLYDNRKNTFTTHGDGSDPTEHGQPGGDTPDPSRPGGGDKPTYGPEDGDAIDFPTLPTTSVLHTGFVNAYAPTSTELIDIANELWANDFINSIQKIMNDPFDAIIGLSLLPFAIPKAGSATKVKIGNFECDSASAKQVTAQWVTISGGSFTLPQNWYNFLDFVATDVCLYLPFVGVIHVDTDDVMGKTIAVQYNIDVLSGSGICCVKCGQSVLYAYPINCSYEIPLTGSNKAALYTGLIQTGISAVTAGIATGPAGAIGAGVSGAAATVASKHSSIQRSGGLSSNSALLGEFNVYLILHRPVQSIPQNMKDFKGYMSNISSKLQQCKGYTEVEYINLAIDGATDKELMEIKQRLSEGVII